MAINFNIGKSLKASVNVPALDNFQSKVSDIRNKATSVLNGGIDFNIGNDGISLNANFNKLIQSKKQAGNLINSPLKSLYRKKYKGLSFPRDLDTDHFMVFRVYRSTRESRTQQVATKETLRTIALPVPNNLQTSYSANYQNQELGLLGAGAAGKINAQQGIAAAKDIGAAVQSKLTAAMGALDGGGISGDDAVRLGSVGATVAGITAAGALAGPIGGALSLGGAESVVQGILLNEGTAINPHLAVLFEGVGFREHQFSYKFIARSQEESVMIDNIIKSFEFHMHPNYKAGTLAFDYPDEFEISFSDSIAPYLYKIHNSVLKTFSVNYNGENLPLFFEQTGAPVSVEITLGFQETKIITKESTNQGIDPSSVSGGA